MELNVLVGEDWVDMTKPGFDLRGQGKTIHRTPSPGI